MPFQQTLQQRLLLMGGDGADLNNLRVHPRSDTPLLIQQEGHTTGHTSADIAAGAAENNDDATGHVLTAVVTSSLHNRAGTAVANTEALTSPAMGKQLTAGGPVEAGVAEDHLVTGRCTTV